jgi:hypothetical protein
MQSTRMHLAGAQVRSWLGLPLSYGYVCVAGSAMTGVHSYCSSTIKGRAREAATSAEDHKE